MIEKKEKYRIESNFIFRKFLAEIDNFFIIHTIYNTNKSGLKFKGHQQDPHSKHKKAAPTGQAVYSHHKKNEIMKNILSLNKLIRIRERSLI